MEIKVFRCGLCKGEGRIARTRKGLREHLKVHIKNSFTNTIGSDKVARKQNWWIVEEFK